MGDAPEARLRVVSYNVHGLHDDLATVGAIVRALAPDVVLVQEAPRRFRWRGKCADLARRGGLLYAAGGLPAVGNLVLVSHRVAVSDTWCLRFPLVPGRHLRGVAFARCSIGAVGFVVAGAHLSTDPAERVSQAVQLAGAIAELPDPVIVGADVNDVPGSPAWAALLRDRTDLGAMAGHAETPTFPSWQASQRLDAIFAGKGVRVREYQVVNTAQAHRASDHLPVVADLELVRPSS